MQPFSPHGRFFSSLEQVEKRLASERKSIPAVPNDRPPPPQHPPPIIDSSSSYPLSSPLYLGHPEPFATPKPPNLQDSSGPPPEFLSRSPTPLTRDQAPPDAEADDIERLMDLLGISGAGSGGGSSCDCSGGGFYSKIAGVKGPRCEREMRRLDGWIEYYYHGGSARGEEGRRKEPARLAYLLLAKAACSDEDEDAFGEIGFPSTVEEFLEHDPPSDGGEHRSIGK